MNLVLGGVVEEITSNGSGTQETTSGGSHEHQTTQTTIKNYEMLFVRGN